MAVRPSFFAELKRRHVWRVVIAYAVAAWLLIQVATQVFPFFNIPNWAVRLVVLLLVIGFPIVVALAWAYEITPEGIRRTESADSPDARPEGEHRQIGRRLNALIVAVLIAAVALMGWRPLVLRQASDAAQRSVPVASTGPAPTTKTAPAQAREAIIATPAVFHPPAGTIVVLPFANLGGDPKQQYFSDGISEELTNALGQKTGLRVIAWDTASKYRDSKQSAAAIARQLNVESVLTGRTLREGDEVRVIVELVNAANGYQLWSDHYDDQLANIFQVQDKISGAIAAALKVKFADANAPRRVNPQAYDLVLKARALTDRARTAAPVEQARTLLEQAIALDPDYADAHAALAHIWFPLTQFSTLPIKDALPKVRAEAPGRSPLTRTMSVRSSRSPSPMQPKASLPRPRPASATPSNSTPATPTRIWTTRSCCRCSSSWPRPSKRYSLIPATPPRRATWPMITSISARTRRPCRPRRPRCGSIRRVPTPPWGLRKPMRCCTATPRRSRPSISPSRRRRSPRR